MRALMPGPSAPSRAFSQAFAFEARRLARRAGLCPVLANQFKADAAQEAHPPASSQGRVWHKARRDPQFRFAQCTSLFQLLQYGLQQGKTHCRPVLVTLRFRFMFCVTAASGTCGPPHNGACAGSNTVQTSKPQKIQKLHVKVLCCSFGKAFQQH